MKSIGFTGVIVNKVCGFGEEREQPQEICIDVSLETDFSTVAEEDDPSAGVDFRTIYALISTGLEGEIYTLEKAALSIWKQIKGINNVGKVKVTVKKNNPLFRDKVEDSWVVIEE
jgi:FolB domain-containing protein